MAEMGKVIKALDNCIHFGCGDECPYYDNGCYSNGMLSDALELLKEREGYVSVPFDWLVKFCTHIDFKEPLSDEEREEQWKEKLRQQFGIEVTNNA